MNLFEDEPNIIGISSKAKTICSICKTALQTTDDQDVLICPICTRLYRPQLEIQEFEDEMVSVHEDEQVELGGISGGTGAGLVTEPDDDLMQPKIKRNRFPLAPNDNLIDFEGEWPSA